MAEPSGAPRCPLRTATCTYCYKHTRLAYLNRAGRERATGTGPAQEQHAEQEMAMEDKKVVAFLERMAKRLSESGGSHSGRHRAAFIALRPLVEHALAQGYTMKATWAALREEKELAMSYETFRMHCWRAGIAVRPDATRLSEVLSRGFRH
jgi:hypothetical protein